MEILWFLIFFVVSRVILNFVLKYTRRREYFWNLLPVVIGFSCLIGFLLYMFQLHNGFYPYLIFNILYTTLTAKKTASADEFLTQSDSDHRDLRLIEAIRSRSGTYFWLTIIVHLIFFAASYLAVINSWIKLF